MPELGRIYAARKGSQGEGEYQVTLFKDGDHIPIFSIYEEDLDQILGLLEGIEDKLGQILDHMKKKEKNGKKGKK